MDFCLARMRNEVSEEQRQEITELLKSCNPATVFAIFQEAALICLGEGISLGTEDEKVKESHIREATKRFVK